MSLAGIDTCIFKGHSFRGASTSDEVSLGVPLDVILKAADWKNAGTFAEFYQRETSSVGQFARLFSHCSLDRRCVFVSRIKCSLEKHSSFGAVYCARESTLNYAI